VEARLDQQEMHQQQMSLCQQMQIQMQQQPSVVEQCGQTVINQAIACGQLSSICSSSPKHQQQQQCLYLQPPGGLQQHGSFATPWSPSALLSPLSSPKVESNCAYQDIPYSPLTSLPSPSLHDFLTDSQQELLSTFSGSNDFK